MTTGEKIREIRTKEKISQHQLSIRTKKMLNQSQISKIEKNNRKITDTDLKIIAKALNVDVVDLISSN